jgi:hypothetical protein
MVCSEHRRGSLPTRPTGGVCVKTWKSRSAAARRAAKRSSYADQSPASRRNVRCTSASASAAGLEKIARRITKSKHALDAKGPERQIGRLQERNARAAARYSMSIEGDDANDEWTDEELWKTYI